MTILLSFVGLDDDIMMMIDDLDLMVSWQVEYVEDLEVN